MSVGVWRLSRPFQIDSWKLSVFSISLLLRTAPKRLQAQVTSATLRRGPKPCGSRWPSTGYHQVPSEKRSESDTSGTETPPSTAFHAQTIVCPECVTQLTFSRNNTSRIDACGFETYSLDCPTCAARLECLVDPSDEALLLSKTTP
jgi:hypothetical protein